MQLSVGIGLTDSRRAEDDARLARPETHGRERPVVAAAAVLKLPAGQVDGLLAVRIADLQPIRVVARRVHDPGLVVGQNLADDGIDRKQLPKFERFDLQSGLPKSSRAESRRFPKEYLDFSISGASLLIGRAKFPLKEFLKLRPGSMDATSGLSGQSSALKIFRNGSFDDSRKWGSERRIECRFRHHHKRIYVESKINTISAKFRDTNRNSHYNSNHS